MRQRVDALEGSSDFSSPDLYSSLEEWYNTGRVDLATRVAALESKLDECDPCTPPDPWKLVMKTQAGSHELGGNSAYWENDALLNADSDPRQAGDAKYAAFLHGPVDALRICTDLPFPDGRCYEHQLPETYESPKALFSAGYIADDTIDQTAMYGIFEAHSKLECGMVLPGFNSYGDNDKSYARFGFMGQIPSQGCDNVDDDWALGIGIDQQASATRCDYGAGVSCHWADNNASPKSWDAWIYFHEAPPPTPVDLGAGWDLVIKTAAGSGVFGGHEAIWENTNLLNQSSPLGDAGDAKYQAFNEGPVDKLRICTDEPYPNGRCYEHTLPGTYDSPRALFSGGFVADPNIDQDAMYGIFEAHSVDCPMNQPGFNSQMSNDFAYARFGFMGQIPSQACDSVDDDWALGIGIDQTAGVSCSYGAGVTCHWADSNTEPKSWDAWIYFHKA